MCAMIAIHAALQIRIRVYTSLQLLDQSTRFHLIDAVAQSRINQPE
jgi:hypothetical protein